jgi:hypothetical protein
VGGGKFSQVRRTVEGIPSWKDKRWRETKTRTMYEISKSVRSERNSDKSSGFGEVYVGEM